MNRKSILSLFFLVLFVALFVLPERRVSAQRPGQKPSGSGTSSRPPVKPAAPVAGTQMNAARGMKFVYIPAGEFQMGSKEFESENPVHKVVISESFWMGKYEVTQAQWKAVMGNNPSECKHCPQCPV